MYKTREAMDEQQRETLARLQDVLTEAELSSDQFIGSSLRDTMLIADLCVNDLTALYFVFADVVEPDFFLFRIRKNLAFFSNRFYSSEALEFILLRAMRRKIRFRNLFRACSNEIYFAT